MRRIAVFVASAALIVSLLPPEALRHSAGVSCKDKTGFRSISQHSALGQGLFVSPRACIISL